VKKCGIGRLALCGLSEKDAHAAASGKRSAGEAHSALFHFSLFLFTFSLLFGCTTASRPPLSDWRIVAADQGSGSAVIVSGEPGAAPTFLWQWDPKKDPNVDAGDAKTFRNIDECKLRDGGDTLIVCASSQGIAGIDMKTGRAKWCAGARHGVPSPHSVELLPDGRVAVACSTGCDALMLYDVASAPFDPAAQRSVRAAKVRGAHGVEWNAARGTLFVLGYTYLYEFAYRPESMSVAELHRWSYVEACGDEFGHDLVPDGKGGYYLTNHTGVWRFDPGDGTFVAVRGQRNAKSFSRNPTNGDLMQIPTESWWSDRLVIANPDGTERILGPFPNARFYKARWAR